MKKAACAELSDLFKKRPYRKCTEGLEIDGVPWIPLVGRNSYLRTEKPSPWHTHRGCIEIIYCQHGVCDYESCGETFRLMPGKVFVSRSTEAHRMMSNPKGLATYYLLFKASGIESGSPVGQEMRFLNQKLGNVPRLFDGGNRTGSWFVRLFRLIDQRFENRAERRLRILNTSLSLLLSVVDAAETMPSKGYSCRILSLAEGMRNHPEEDYPIDALATMAGFSPSSLISGFKTPLKCVREEGRERGSRAGENELESGVGVEEWNDSF